ncbi:MAG: DUF4037 domain-containing protein [Oscillospiraceae bacterium]|nr:DUF4037 domain-containing protein [Oscillospiraceae bacterium]
MRGLDEARALYEEHGRPLLHEQFPELEERVAVGLAGHGSECFGFDDELSRDHDFARGFCLWLTDEDDLRWGVALARAYRTLPLGPAGQRSALAEDNCGVRRTAFFYRRYTGSAGAPESWQQWLSIPSWALAEATNGEVFRDDLGAFSAIRETLLHGMPEDVRKKHLAARLIEMAQAGQYNFPRCLQHGEPGAAALMLADFVRAACGAVYLLERRHMPYSKWMLRGMDALTGLGQLRTALEFLLSGEGDAALRRGVVEDVCATVAAELRAQGLSEGDWDYLEPHAFAVQNSIEDRQIRAMHVMEG